MKAFVVAFCTILLATPVIAQPSAPAGAGGAGVSSPSGAPESANQRGNTARDARQICRRIAPNASTRLGSRLVCHTAEEWRDLQDNY